MQISNLLRYNFQDIQYNLKMTDANITTRIKQAKHQLHRTPSQLRQKTEPARLEIDSTAFWASVGLQTPGEFCRTQAQQGEQAVKDYATERSSRAEYLNHIEKGNNIAQIYRRKFLQRAQTELHIKRTAPKEITYIPARVSHQYIPEQLQYSWDVEKYPQEYTPPDAGVEMTDRPGVTYDYLGRPRLFAENNARSFNIRV